MTIYIKNAEVGISGTWSFIRAKYDDQDFNTIKALGRCITQENDNHFHMNGYIRIWLK